MKLSPTQRKVLHGALEGRLAYARDMGWFQKGGYRLARDRDPLPATVEKLKALGLVRQPPVPMGDSHVDLEITEAGRRALA